MVEWLSDFTAFILEKTIIFIGSFTGSEKEMHKEKMCGIGKSSSL